EHFVPVFKSVVNARNVRLVQAGRVLGLAQEPLSRPLAIPKMGRNALDGDGALELGVRSAVNLSHAARAQFGVDEETTDRRAGEIAGCSRGRLRLSRGSSHLASPRSQSMARKCRPQSLAESWQVHRLG